jgi:hypothetical protein
MLINTSTHDNCLYAILSYRRKILHMETGINFSNQDNMQLLIPGASQ